jgi:quinoprotein glucose dehydrogenase
MSRIGLVVAIVLFACTEGTLGTQGTSGTLKGEWTHYGGNAASQKYSPLDQINKDTIGKLTVAWRWTSPITPSSRPITTARPGGYADTVMVKGVLYTVTSLGQIAAINPGRSQTIWTVDRWKTRPASQSLCSSRSRLLERWEDRTLLLGTHDAYLISVDAKTGAWISPLAKRAASVDGIACAPCAPRILGERRPVVCKDVIVVGASIPTARRTRNGAGDVGGFDVRTGKKLDDSLDSAEGRVGNETWGDDSWTYTGSTNVWTNMSSDEELGYVFLPFSPPTTSTGVIVLAPTCSPRPIMAIDAKTGKRAGTSACITASGTTTFRRRRSRADINVNGTNQSPRASEQARFHMHPRSTNRRASVPVEERPVPQSTVPGDTLVANAAVPDQPPPTSAKA